MWGLFNSIFTDSVIRVVSFKLDSLLTELSNSPSIKTLMDDLKFGHVYVCNQCTNDKCIY